MQAFINGAWRTPTAVQRFTAGAWRAGINAKAYIGGVWRDGATFSAAPTLSISGNSVSTGKTVGPLTATPAGGVGPFSYLWTVTASAAPVTFSTATAATTSASVIVPTADRTATLQCVVTDSLARTASSSIDCIFNLSFL